MEQQTRDSEKQKESKKPQVPDMIQFSKFFTYINTKEKLLQIFGLIGAVIAGIGLPGISVVMGEITDTFNPDEVNSVRDTMRKVSIIITIVGCVLWVFGYIYFAFWQHLAENISFDLRSRYLKSLLKQEVEYFEKIDVSQLPSQIGENFSTIQQSIGEKYSNIIFSCMTTVSGLGIAFYTAPILAAIYVVYFPLIFGVVIIFGSSVKNAAIAKIMVIKQLGGIVEESLSSIKLIVSFANEDKELKKFQDQALKVKEIAQSSEKKTAFFMQFIRFTIFSFYVYGFWIGSHFIYKEKINPRTDKLYTSGEILTTMIGLITGLTMLMSLTPNIQAIVKARIVGKQVFDVIDKSPTICDVESPIKNFEIKDKISFKEVTFRYPKSQNNQDILNKASFNIKAGQTTAIVGPSGSGKSTIVQLIERFYDPSEGTISFDEVNLKNIELKSLRESIGYVSQEPVLILGSIRDNLLFGNKDATEEDIQRALRQANATFINENEIQLDSYVGSASVMNLSGGQKQRIAIARALIKKPKILILDEATSALDPKSEKEVQDAIDNISKGQDQLTIIMIAHRLQTIETAQNLLYIQTNQNLVSASKGSQKYGEIMIKLQEQNYKHQAQEILEDQQTDQTEVQQELKKSGSSSLINIDLKENQDQDNKDTQDQKEQRSQGMGRIMSYYGPKWISIFAILSSIVNSFVFPMYGFLLSQILFVLMKPEDQNYKRDRNFWCLMFLVLAVSSLVFGFMQKYIHSYLGENLTLKVRSRLFEQILYKNISWFDSKDKAPGILSNVLSEDISKLNGLTTETIAIIGEVILTMVIGISISFAFSWRIALVCIATSPLIFVGGIAMSKLQWKQKSGVVKTENEVDHYKKSNALLSDIVMNYRTVIGFGDKNIEYLMAKYQNLLNEPNRIGIRNAHLSGFFFGYSQCTRFAFIGLVFFIAAIFIETYGEDPDKIYVGVYVLFVAALGSGIAMANVPSISVAKASAKTIFEIIDTSTSIDSREKEGEKEIKNGEVQLKNVSFKYPSRNEKVLKNFNIIIRPNMKVALVGASGSGKSTIANLLLRFYDVTSGSIMIDGKDIREYNVSELRKQIGIVMQEPQLFNMSIKENILYGNDKATDMKIKEVAELANAIEFIEKSNDQENDEDNSQKARQQIEDILIKLSQNYQNLMIISRYVQQGQLKSEEMKILQQIMIHGDKEFLSQVNENVQMFIDLFENKIDTFGIRWDNLILEFEWELELVKVIRKLHSHDQRERITQIIEKAKSKHFLQFDEQTIQDWLQYIDELEKLDEEDLGLEDYIVNDEQRIQSLKKARIQKLLQENQNQEDDGEFKLHEGFNQNCGLKGSMLSGGQKQRIAIARALIKDPKILILDEATSALDEKSQEIVQQALDRAMEGRTSIVIAHRLSTIRNCDWLFVINKGELMEQGTYEELSANQNSYFYKLKSGMEM